METKEKANKAYESQLNDWISQEKAAIDLIGIIGKLWFEKSIELILFRNQLVDRSASEIMKLHLYAKDIVKKTISVSDTVMLANDLYKSDVCPSRIDIGKLAFEYQQEKANFKSSSEFINHKLKDLIGTNTVQTPKDVILYGFGRIGRLAAREIISQAGKGEQLRLRAIVTRGNSDEEIVKRADLLRTDSVHGPFKGIITEDFPNRALIINGQTVCFIEAKEPNEIDYTHYGISDALLIDNTGIYRDREGLSLHLSAKGIDKVLLTAPAKGDVLNIVSGINDMNADITKHQVLSNASCTTNAIVPVLKIIDDAYGIEKGHIESIHSYTNDQNLLDNYHKKYRRGRAAALNLVITETGADKAVMRVIPHLEGKITGNAVRVPSPNVSLAILNLSLKTESTRDEIIETIKQASLFGNLSEQIELSVSNELVSSDLIGNSHAAIIDGPATIMAKDNWSVVLYAWYDNEYGYTRQVVRLAKKMAGVVRLTYY